MSPNEGDALYGSLSRERDEAQRDLELSRCEVERLAVEVQAAVDALKGKQPFLHESYPTGETIRTRLEEIKRLEATVEARRTAISRISRNGN